KFMGKYSKKREGTSNRQFTNVEKLKNNFFANSERRRKSNDKAHDCEALAEFFNATANISDDVEQIKLSANEQTFNQKKQFLVNKIQGLPYLNTFSTKLQRQLKEVENLTPKHQQDLLKLEIEAKQAESEYKESKAKADQETDPDKKAQFMILANKAAKKAEDIKRRIKANPLADLSRFSNLDDLTILLGGNVPQNPPSSNRPSGSVAKSKKKKQQQRQMFLLLLLAVGAAYYFMIYLPEEEKKKKLEQQQANTNNKIVKAKTSALIGQYQKLASLFADGDRNPKFYFSRAATYKIYFPPSLREYYEKGQESKDDSFRSKLSMLEEEEKLILSDEISQ
ncbi:4960_t:CDS:2, partial [Funneliformis geosporum]